MTKKKSAGTATTTAAMIDREIGAIASSESALAAPPAATPAPDMTPLEAAVICLSHDLNTVLRQCHEIREAVSAFETFARAVSVDMRDIRAAIRKP